MLVGATILHKNQAIPVRLSQDDMDALARIFELGVNVGPDEAQSIRVLITTPGYSEEEMQNIEDERMGEARVP